MAAGDPRPLSGPHTGPVRRRCRGRGTVHRHRQPHRIEGLAAYAEFVRAGRASLPFRFTGFEDVLVHHTEDPATAVVEYRLLGQLAGQVRSAPFLVVVTVDEQDRIVRWREYQDRPAIAAALAAATPPNGSTSPTPRRPRRRIWRP